MAADLCQQESAECCDANKSNCILEEFKEIEEIRKLVINLREICNNETALEASCERFVYIVDQYQEQPHLIDSYLESIVSSLLKMARDPLSPESLMHQAFKYLYLITKMRGYKVIVHLLPHEVSDLEPLLIMLLKQNTQNFQTWETRYMLLLWLSIACMIPFDLTKLDSNASSGDTSLPIMERIMDQGMLYLNASDKSRDAAAYLMAKFMTRPDVKKKKLPEFIDWTLKIFDTADRNTMPVRNSLAGILSTLSLLFKHGKREDLLEFAPVVLRKLSVCKLTANSDTLLRKSAIKVVQRLGLIFLKSKVATWRYQRGSRSLAANLRPLQEKHFESNKMVVEEEEDYDVPDEIEDIIEELLGRLKDKVTVVRWSAAKGIGRVTGRLPKELADDVVASILDLFTLQESDEAWHGGCMALAELGRRGLLLPHRLSDVVPVVLKALTYDEKRGNFSVGSHVRDAACYVCWSFARAYEPQELQPYVQEIASALVIVSVLDREVNVRRAASAAFQENVGRQGTFPHGIDILTTADYYAVGSRSYCYSELSISIAQYSEYTISLIDHLVHVKISHWDNNIRELSAKALHNLTALAPDYMSKSILSLLLPWTTGIDLYLRHGSILAAAEIAYALAKMAFRENGLIEDMIDKENLGEFCLITQKLKEKKLFRGLGGELMRRAEKLSLSRMVPSDSVVIDLWQEIIDDCLFHEETEIRSSAVSTIPAFFTQYYIDSNGLVKQEKTDRLVERYIAELKCDTEIKRMGYCLALGALPKSMIVGKLQGILSGLIVASYDVEIWAECHRDALKAITRLCNNVGIEIAGKPTDVVCADNITELFNAFFAAAKDYTLDSRGDVGAWVREASMAAIHDLISLAVKAGFQSLINPKICERTMCFLIQQACEKIDRTRAYAGSIFSKLLYHIPDVPNIPQRKELLAVFPRADIESINWASPAETFPRFVSLLQYPVYTYSVLLGVTVSVGGLTESLVKHSSAALYSYLRILSSQDLKFSHFIKTLLKIFQDKQKIDRVTLPLMKMIDQLMARGCFNCFCDKENETFPMDFFELCKKEVFKCSEPQKLLASIDIFCGLLQFSGKAGQKSLSQLLLFLCHRYPIVRKNAANKLYEALMLFENVVPDTNLDNIMTLLSETQWDEKVETLRAIRNELCDLMKVARPVMKEKKQV